MIDPGTIQRVTVVGSGTIGASWALFFLARGLDVTLYDAAPGQAAFALSYIERHWPIVAKLGIARIDRPPTPRFVVDLHDAVADAQFIQENVPDDLAIKHAMYQQLDEIIGEATIIASSTSSLKMSDIQRGRRRAGQMVVAHPFNPPHLLPLVEVVGGDATTPETVATTTAFFRHHGRTVLTMHKEVTGHVVNRLQGALFQEAMSLIEQGVVDVAGIDDGIAFGPGLRWAVFGPFLSFHLAAQGGGIRRYLESLGPAHERIWRDLGHLPDGITPELIERVAQQTDEAAQGATIDQLTEVRDERMVSIVSDAVRAAGRQSADRP